MNDNYEKYTQGRQAGRQARQAGKVVVITRWQCEAAINGHSPIIIIGPAYSCVQYSLECYELRDSEYEYEYSSMETKSS